ncbi:autotransporter outer membrane beta-barrel domain-containing protein [Pseudochrobactrum kiredjianiae]|uniref:Autotransporter domain-containing protein n=1 Tax=Pseudochrobactrum kiredjianiae TaxID=386305 RepID=A0ABW3V338_9HYPH|nr:autotransporter domain-containing protein [Pseudochrobactrum kiredjianiae]MDM7853022.1 autotransporter domain-containing protein [Pseudochrobactrum kiredjianiae]
MKKQRSGAGQKRNLGAGVAGALLLAALGTHAQAEEAKDKSFSLTVMGFNIWNNNVNSKMWDAEAKKNGQLIYNQTMKDLLLGVAPDVLVLPELYNNSGKKLGDKSVVDAHVQNTLDLLNANPDKLGNYEKIKDNDDREGSGMVISAGQSDYLGANTIRMKPGNGFPDTVITGRHFNYYDEPTNRIKQAKEANTLAQSTAIPTILVGDLNAGDVSERGLLSVDAQLRLMKQATGNKLYSDLSAEYLELADKTKWRAIIQDAHKGVNIDTLSWNQWGTALEKAYKAGKDIGLVDETYPVKNNLPVTMNILKQQHQLIQLDRNREQFNPSQVGDERATWTSDGEESTNTWASWDRVNIDHILVSRPFAKWIEIVDNGKWSGTLSKPALLPNGNSLSDHDPIAQDLRWIGPKLETYKDGDVEKTRIVWGADASGFEAKGKEFYLTRNNNRNDTYLGQIADENGNPILKDLTQEEKQTLLDCKTTDDRFAQAVKDYCIDNHEFIGQTLVTDGGTIIVDEDAALGTAKADLYLADGGLKIAGQAMNALDRKLILNGTGRIDVADAQNELLVKQEISGSGGLVKQGEGTLVLGQANSHQGGTFVEKGILRADVAGALVDNTTLVVNGGKLDLNGHDLKASSLSGKGGSLDLNSAALEINQTLNTRFDGTIDGQGDLTKNGTGILVLNGKNSYQGTTTVNGGGLIVGDADHRDASVSGIIKVSNGAFLAGSGMLGGIHVAAGSVLAPGNSIGTLKASGDLVMEAGSLYEAEINPDGTSDLIQVGAAAIIDGANVHVEKATGSYKANTRYTILTADGGITGTFADMSQNKPFIDLNLVYDPKTVYLDALRNSTSFASVAQTENQQAVASAAEGLGIGNAVYDAIAGQDSDANARVAFDMLSGEVHASSKTALINTSSDLRNAAQDRLRSAFGDINAQKGAQVVSANDAPAALWVQSFGTWTENSSNGNAAKLSQTTGGIFAGYDAEVAENLRLGALAGYSRTSFDVDDRASSGESDNYHLGLYGGSHWGNTALSGGIAYSWHSVDTSRSVFFPDFSEKLTADYNAGTVQAFGELSHKLKTSNAVFEPFANLAYVSLKTDGFTETGGQAALTIDRDRMSTVFTTLGIRGATEMMFGNVKTELNGTLGWQHAFNDVDSVTRASFSNGSAFDISGVPVAKDTALVQAGFDIKASETATFGISYRGQFGSGFQSNSVNAKLGIKF